ncbi:hypothetical protein GJT87_01045 [Enterobacteriaceae endosymbiont of Macroplea mutica]|uniref:hypothetical protein n=1 Tax=Enterobacteriaceae endosymbiont of Macroplea mutica TaxID=2675791 RepID=UPI00144A2AC4|nr:hypothetical protein [Enterobacteriaceae endosymbiont of Macroplea mutica]QJC31236.1 hypothetical protein GJT87_01045 [Enterobacteriaceae endosymbiont of Macroplea mutica]
MNICNILWQSMFIIKLSIIILIILLFISFIIIVKKYFLITQLLYLLIIFKKTFWSGKKLSDIYKDIQIQKNIFGIEKIFYEGFKKFIQTYDYITNIPEIVIKDTTVTINLYIKQELIELQSYMMYLDNINIVISYFIMLGNIYIIFGIYQSLMYFKLNIILTHLSFNIFAILIMLIIGISIKTFIAISYNIINQYIENILLQYNLFTQEILLMLYKKIFLKKKFINYMNK